MRVRLHLALLCALLVPAPAGAAVLAHAGRYVTDAQGRVFVAHGLNVVFKTPPYTPEAAGFGAPDAALLAANGLNTVRLGIIWEALEPQPGRFDDAYLASVARTQQTLARAGVISLIDFHQDSLSEQFSGEGFPKWAVQTGGLPTPSGVLGQESPGSGYSHAWDSFWANSRAPDGVGLQDHYAAAWRHVAERFAGLPGVLGYDVMNEPGPGSRVALCLNPLGCPLDGDLASFYVRIAAQIRATGDRHLIWEEPNLLYDGGGAESLPSLLDPQVGFTFHDYCISQLLNGGADSAACPADEQLVLSHAEAQSAATGDALLMGEFGSTPDLNLVGRVESESDADRLGWIEWTYHVNGLPGADFPGTPSLVEDLHKPRAGTNVNTALLRVLAHPYPQAVAGTPESWAFATATRTFTLRFSTVRAGGGGAFPAGSVTTVSAPAVEYPGGYVASASGATVFSPPGAPVLTLASCPGTGSVTLTVAPAGPSSQSCRAALVASVSPRRVRLGRPAFVTVRVAATLGALRAPAARVLVSLAGHRAVTDADGRARLRVTLARPARLLASDPRFTPAALTVR